VFTLKGHSNAVEVVLFSPDNKFIYTGSQDKSIRIWDFVTGVQIISITGHSNWVSNLVFFQNGDRVLSSSWDKSLKVWDRTLWHENSSSTNKNNHKERVRTCNISKDAKFIVSGAEDAKVKIWDDKGNLINNITFHKGQVQSVRFSNDCKFVISNSSDGIINIFDVASGNIIHSYEKKYCLYCDFSPSGKQFFYSQLDPSFNPETFEPCKDNNSLYLCDTETGQLINRFEDHNGNINQAASSMDFKFIFTASDDRTVKMFEVSSGKCVKTFNGHTGDVKSVGVSIDGKLLVSGGWDNSVKIWSIESGECIRTLIGHTNLVFLVGFSADTKWILSSSRDATSRIWDVENGLLLATITDSDCATISKNRLITFSTAATFHISAFEIIVQ